MHVQPEVLQHIFHFFIIMLIAKDEQPLPQLKPVKELMFIKT